MSRDYVGTKILDKIITKEDMNMVESAFESLRFGLLENIGHLSDSLN